MSEGGSFAARFPLAWSYHRNTSRWPFNMHGLNETGEAPAFKELLGAPLTELPEPSLPERPLAGLLRERQSCRSFSGSALPLVALSSLLHAGYGITGRAALGGGEFLDRTVPSGGGLYPLELYVLAQHVEGLAGGVHHYVPLGHRLETVVDARLPQHLTAELFLGQPYLMRAGAILVVTAWLARSLWKYEDRGYRYMLLEAGHVGQNVLLAATALGLGALPLGGFFDDDLARLLRLGREQEIPLYACALGTPCGEDREARRLPPDSDPQIRNY
jgi:SagB-type dehydrogenase family enzyme